MRLRTWHKFLILFLIITGLVAIVFHNKMYVKSVLRKQPAVYRLIQKVKNYLSNEWDKKTKSVRQKEKIVNIEVDANKVLEKFTPFWGGFGHDQFYSGVIEPKNREFFKLIKEINQTGKAFTYYRSHNMFSDLESSSSINCGGKVYSEDSFGNPQYNWRRVDKVFDTILSANMKPIVEFSFMPEMLASDHRRIGD